jgi:hypothetical protein
VRVVFDSAVVFGSAGLPFCFVHYFFGRGAEELAGYGAGVCGTIGLLVAFFLSVFFDFFGGFCDSCDEADEAVAVGLRGDGGYEAFVVGHAFPDVFGLFYEAVLLGVSYWVILEGKECLL